MIHRYEGVCIAKVVGLVEADTQEEVREKLHSQEDWGEIIDIALQPIALMDELDAVSEKKENNNG